MGSIKHQIVNPDLAEERQKCDFNVTELSDMIHIPGMKALHAKFKEDIQRYPEELKAPPQYFEWSIEERHRWHWRRHAKLQEINADLYFHNIDSRRGVDLPMLLTPGTDPTMLHTAVFSNAV